MHNSSRTRPATISPRKKLLFVSFMIFFVLVIIEGGVRVIEVAQRAVTVEENPYVDIINGVPVFQLDDSDGEKVFRRTRHHKLISYDLEFPAEKTADTFRVFLVGGSAAKSWPHDTSQFTISALLERKLSQVVPDRHFEVLSVTGMTYASHRVKWIFDEVMEYEPDLILIYSGNNEFLENFVFRIEPLPRPWRYLATVRIIHKAWGRLVDETPSTIDIKNYSYKDHISNRLSWTFAKASRLRRDPEQFGMLLEHYRYNIDYMVRQCKKRNVRVMLMNVPVNMKDWHPNVSVHRDDITPRELELWQAHFREGLLAIESGDYSRALGALDRAVRVDEEHAETNYYLGVALQRTGQIEKAKAAYAQAVATDAFPFRALPQFQTVLAQVAEAYAIPLLDIVGALEQQADDGIMGYDVLVDYVHLTPKSCEIIAHEVLVAMERLGVLPGPSVVSVEHSRTPIPDLTRSTRVLLMLFLNDLIMRQYDSMDELTEEIIERANLDARERPELADDARNAVEYVRMIMRTIIPYRKMLRAEKLGLLQEEFTEDEAREIYDAFVRLIYEIEGREIPREKFSAFVPPLRYRGEIVD